jgi:hypothetical protein
MEASHNKNAGMNYPPQSTNSSIMKYAYVMKMKIEDNDLDDKVKFFPSMTSRYQSAREDYAAQWAITQTELMEKLLCMLYPRSFKSRIRHHGPLDQRINKQP